MPPIKNLEEAVRVAEQLLERYYPFRRLIGAKRELGTWLIEFDVGVFGRELASIRLDTNTGEITEYSTTSVAE